MKYRLLIMAALLSATNATLSCAQTSPQVPTEEKSDATADPWVAEKAAIRAGSEAFVAAFNKADATAIAAAWTEDGEYIDDSGRRIAGREAIEQDYSAFFAENPDAKIQIAIDSLRLLSDNVAIEDGRAIVDPPPPGAPGVSQYTAIHCNVDGKWLMASVRDTWVEAQVSRQSVADLGWLIGTWVAEEHGVKSVSVCRWVADKNFIQRDFTTTAVDGTKTSGVQLIGWNPLDGHVESWSFDPDGGHDFGIWSPVHGGWKSEMRGVTGAGAPTSSVRTLTRLDDNAYVWQSVARSVGGIQLPNTDEIVIKRQTPTPASKATAR